MAERSADREREDTYRNKVLEDTKTTRDEDRKTRAAEREFDRKEAEKRLEAEKVLRERELALRIRQLDDAKARGEKEDARAAELERTRTRMSTFDRHFKAGTEMSPEDVAAEIEDSPGCLAKILKLFKGTKVNVEYMYAVAGATQGKAVMVFRFSDNDLAIEIMQKNGVQLLDAAAFGILETQP
jgi:hypothetical protein